MRGPVKKDPLRPIDLGHVPPAPRSRAAMAMAVRAGQGRFMLQACVRCEAVTYPPRDCCPACWGALAWRDQPQGGRVVAQTDVRVSADIYFRGQMPWRIGTVVLDAGPVAVAHLAEGVVVGDPVQLVQRLDRAGQAAMIALPAEGTYDMSEDRQLRQFTAEPLHRRVLVTDGRTATGQAVARALMVAGARSVFLGNADPMMRYTGQEIEAEEGIDPVALDLTNTKSVEDLATQLGGRIEMVVNTAQYTRAGAVAFGGALTDLQAAMDVTVSGTMRLAQALGPVLAARSGDGDFSAAAFVDVGSVYGLVGHGGFAGSAAAASARMSLMASLRAEMAHKGIRVMQVLTGPIEDGWHQHIPPPKVTPDQIARAVVTALREGQELTPVGDVAKDILARWLDDPLLSIREAQA